MGHQDSPTLIKPFDIEIVPNLKMVNYTHGLVLLCTCLLITNIYGKNYDYIVLGGGTSGCIVAEKLSRDLNVEVLLLEKGDDISDLMSPAVAYRMDMS